jgi:cytochrome b pre-mRNA-processing protein 3
MIWRKLLGGKPDKEEGLYASLVETARAEHFYRDMGVPDTVDGRFEMIVVHMFLMLNALKGEEAGLEALRQGLTDTFFKDMDRSLREMGVGDLSVGKKVRKMAEAFYGRVAAYAEGLKAGESGLHEALARNIFADVPNGKPDDLAKWMLRSSKALEQAGPDTVARGEFQWS